MVIERKPLVAVATAGLLALAIANPIAAALIAAMLVVLSLWLVFAARRLVRRMLEFGRRPATSGRDAH